MSDLRKVPSVDKLKRDPALGRFPDAVRSQAARLAVAQARKSIEQGHVFDLEAFAEREALRLTAPSLKPCINASGVVLHTGLGRARLPEEAVARIAEVAGSHSAVELDLETGRRGDRQDHVRGLLIELTGAEDALVVNNCAAAVFLTLNALCSGSEVILSRGQMVEIGGSFRMPDIVRQSGCALVEVGCTNRTRLSDYANAISDQTSAILRCHPSNFAIVGFHEEPSLNELSELARSRGKFLLDDAGSGCLLDTRQFGLAKEPTLQEAVSAGADIVMASGDKLLGGPQAGLIVGKAALIKRIRAHPLARAVRVDKLTLAGLEATLRLYSQNRAQDIPVWRSLSKDLTSVKRSAQRLKRACPGSVICEGATEVGGGAMPGNSVPSWRLGIPADDADELLAALRNNDPPIIGRIEDGKVWLDLRTVEDGELRTIENALRGLT